MCIRSPIHLFLYRTPRFFSPDKHWLVVLFIFLSDVDSMHFVTFLLLHVKRLHWKIDLC